ncbi:hypothetical protein [Helicovermis profundi]|uniref:DUF3298 domain-containing protein n=1 Tax=Helicovermis profundi TaxID=3065157 RepID=A0AAU9EKD7_9FIRM|nr:hypothetical protein HLPR_23940 [Clostridia bacterium S502]
MKKKIVLIIICSLIFFSTVIYVNRNQTNLTNIKFDYTKLLKVNKPNILMEDLSTSLKNKDVKNVSLLAFELENSQKQYLAYYNDQIYYDGNHKKIYSFFREGFNIEKLKTIKDENFRELISEILDSGYKIVKINKIYKLIIDYDRYRKYYPYMNQEAKMYFHLVFREYSLPSKINSANSLSYFEIADRIVEGDKFILKYPFSKKTNSVLNYETNLFWRIFDANSYPDILTKEGKVKPEVINIYKYINENVFNKGFNDFLNGYLKFLSENEYIYNDKTYKYIINNDNFYNFNVLNYEKEKILIESIDGAKENGRYFYPQIHGYSKSKIMKYFNKNLRDISSKINDYEHNKEYFYRKISLWSDYVINYNKDGILSLEFYADYNFNNTNRTDYLLYSINFDFNTGRILELKDIFDDFSKYKTNILDEIKEYASKSSYKNYIKLDDFDNLENMEFLINDDRIDILYDVKLIDRSATTIKIPVNFSNIKDN